MQRSSQQKEYQQMLQFEVIQIEREEREENVKRIQRAREYQQSLILEKIELDAQRSKVLAAEKIKLMQLRNKSKEEAIATKVEIMNKFEKLRKKGINKDDLKELGFDELNDKYDSVPQLGNQLQTKTTEPETLRMTRRSNTQVEFVNGVAKQSQDAHFLSNKNPSDLTLLE